MTLWPGATTSTRCTKGAPKESGFYGGWEEHFPPAHFAAFMLALYWPSWSMLALHGAEDQWPSWFAFTNRFAGVIIQVCHLFRRGLIFTLWYFFTKCGKPDPSYHILFSFSSDKDRTTDSRIRRKNTAQPRRESNPGSCEFDPSYLSSLMPSPSSTS